MNQLQLAICENYRMKHRYNLSVAGGDKRIKDKRSGSLYLEVIPQFALETTKEQAREDIQQDSFN